MACFLANRAIILTNDTVDAANGVDLDDAEQRRTYTAYHNAMQARADHGDYEDILDPNEVQEEEVQGSQSGGFFGLFRR